MIFVRFLTLIICFGVSSSVYSFQKGWNYRNFYQETENCRASVVLSASESYIDAWKKDGAQESDVIQWVIAMAPGFQYIGTSTCLCMFDNIAKEMKYDAYIEMYTSVDASGRMVQRKALKNSEKCKSVAVDAYKEVNDNPTKYRLK